MPTYEYECEKCDGAFECVQSMKDDPFKVCPKGLCRMKKWGKGKVRKLISAGAGLIFKGSGFYITDYRSDKYKAAAKADSATAPSSSGESKSGSSSAEGKSGTSSGSESKSATASGGESKSKGAKAETKSPASGSKGSSS